MRAGADGFCVKGISTEQLQKLIHDVVRGVFWVDAAVANQIKRQLQDTHERVVDTLTEPVPKEIETLTEREREVLCLIAKGKKNTEISDLLFISPGTVRVHVHAILHKLNVKDRTQATLFFLRGGSPT